MRNTAYWLTSKHHKTGFAKDKALVTLGERRSIAAASGER